MRPSASPAGSYFLLHGARHAPHTKQTKLESCEMVQVCLKAKSIGLVKFEVVVKQDHTHCTQYSGAHAAVAKPTIRT